MQTVIHDPFSGSTPSQRLAAAAHNMRRARIAARAFDPPPRPVPRLIETVRKIYVVSPEAFYPCMWFYDLVNAPLIPRDRALSIIEIQRATALHFNITLSEFLCNRRHAETVRARQIGMYLAKTLTPFTLPQIGRRFAGKDHTTVLHGVRKIERLLHTDQILFGDVTAIKLALA